MCGGCCWCMYSKKGLPGCCNHGTGQALPQWGVTQKAPLSPTRCLTPGTPLCLLSLLRRAAPQAQLLIIIPVRRYTCKML